jgi:hypothetical protein
MSSTEIANQAEISQALINFLTPDEVARIIVFGIGKMISRFGIFYDPNKGIAGIMMQDMIQDTNLSFLTDSGRNWYHKNTPEFRDQYYSAFESTISNTLKAQLKRAVNHFEIIETDALSAPVAMEIRDQIQMLENEFKKLNASDDEILLFELYYIDRMKRKKIAAYFGVPPQKITDLKKKLDRKLLLIREKWDPE